MGLLGEYIDDYLGDSSAPVSNTQSKPSSSILGSLLDEYEDDYMGSARSASVAQSSNSGAIYDAVKSTGKEIVRDGSAKDATWDYLDSTISKPKSGGFVKNLAKDAANVDSWKQLGSGIKRGLYGMGASVGEIIQLVQPGARNPLGLDPEKLLKTFGIEADEGSLLESGLNWNRNLKKAIDDFGGEVRDYWKGLAEESTDDELAQASWSDRPFAKAAAVVGEATPLYGVAGTASVLAKAPAIAASIFGIVQAAGTTSKAKEKGESEDVARVYGFLDGAWTAASEGIPFSKMLGNAGKRALTRIVKGGITEGTQELIQNVGSNALAKYGYDESVNLMDGWVEAIVGGGVLGAAAGGVIRTKQQGDIQDGIRQDEIKGQQVEDVRRDDKQEVSEQLGQERSQEEFDVQGETRSVLEPAEGLATDVGVAEEVAPAPFVSAEEAADKLASEIGKAQEVKPVLKPVKGGTLQDLEVQDKVETKPKLIAQTKTKVAQRQLPIGEGDKRKSRLAERVSETLKAADSDMQLDIPQYNVMNKQKQIKDATAYVVDNPKEAIQVLKGERQPPKDLLYNSISLALREYASGTKDIGMITDIASLAATKQGQEISILTEAKVDDPVKYVVSLRKRRIESFGNQQELKVRKKREVSELKKAVRKSKPTVKDWGSFVEKLRC